MTSKGMGKCDAGARAEQCGNERQVKKGQGEHMEKGMAKNFFTPELPVGHLENLTSLNKQLAALELDLNKIREKILKLKSD